MLASQFQTGSALHLLTVAICFAIIAVTPFAARFVDTTKEAHLVRLIVGWGCIVVWLLNTAWQFGPERFSWSTALPLHYCNLANLIGAVAVLTRIRLTQSLIYFWSLGLCIWAFLTPTVQLGPDAPDFWIFWIYHLFIGLALVHVLVLDRFRPSARDFLTTCALTLTYTLLLAGLGAITGWNYGFVGPSSPSSPTPVDLLGPYPLRVVWMILLAAIVFVLLWLPWRCCSRPSSDP